MPSISEIGRSSGTSTQTDNDYERFDVSGLPWVKAHPTTAVGGTPVALRRFWSQDEGEDDYVGLVLDDPFVETDGELTEGSIIVENSGETGDDFKVVNTNDEATKLLTDTGPVDADEVEDFDDVTGVDFDSNSFYGDVVDDFGAERVVLKLSGSAGMSATRALDANGLRNARPIREDGGIVIDDDGLVSMTHGLVEKHPDNYDDETDSYTPPRYARDPQLREDVTGETIAILLRRAKDVPDVSDDARGYWANVMVEGEESGDFAEIGPIEDPDAVDEALLEATEWLEWNFPDEDELAEAQGETVEA